MTGKMTIDTTVTLNNGVEMPVLGLGTYLSGDDSHTREVVLHALEVGYRHIDTAAFYGNERPIGEAVRAAARELGIPREDIFVTTKLWNSDHGFGEALAAFEKSRTRLGLDYVDLYLVHWPVEGLRMESWRALEKLYADGACRALGVSNYMPRHLEEVLEGSEIVPVVNQVEFSPFLYQEGLLRFCMERKIVVEAYSPLTKGHLLDDGGLGEVAGRYRRSVAQVLIRWALQKGLVVLPKSSDKGRIIENATVYDFEITNGDMEFWTPSTGTTTPPGTRRMRRDAWFLRRMREEDVIRMVGEESNRSARWDDPLLRVKVIMLFIAVFMVFTVLRHLATLRGRKWPEAIELALSLTSVCVVALVITCVCVAVLVTHSILKDKTDVLSEFIVRGLQSLSRNQGTVAPAPVDLDTRLCIRPAVETDASFLAWAILTAGRAHVKRGIWEIVLKGTEDECLTFLERLVVTAEPHLFHHSCFIIAELEGKPVAALSGHDPRTHGYDRLRKALPAEFEETGLQAPDMESDERISGILDCIPEGKDGAWVIDSVATVPWARRRGIAGLLMEDMLETGRKQGYRIGQVSIYIGNAAARALYEKHGFRVVEEKRAGLFRDEIGSPGMACLLRDL